MWRQDLRQKSQGLLLTDLLTQAAFLIQSPASPTQDTSLVGNQETDLTDPPTGQSYRGTLLTESPSPQVCLGVAHGQLE